MRVHQRGSYSFGLDDHDFVVTLETDEPRDFLDLAQPPAHDGTSR